MGLVGEQQSINYLAKSILTNVAVNISVNFVRMMFRYINMTAKKAGADFKDAETRARVAAMKNAIIRGTDFDSTVTDWATKAIEDICGVLPDLEAFPLRLRTYELPYGLKAAPLLFLAAYCKLARLFEANDLKSFSAMPL